MNRVGSFSVWLFFGSFFLLSCNDMGRNEKKCGDTSIVILAHTIESGLKNIVIRYGNKGDTVFLDELVGELDIFKELESEFVRLAGGLNPETGILLDGCESGNDAQLVFDKINMYSVITDLEKMKSKFPQQKEQKLLQGIMSIIESDIIGNPTMYNNLSNVKYSEILMNVLVIHNKIYILILDEYLFFPDSV